MTPEEIVHRHWTRVWLERDLSALGELYTDPTIRHSVEGSRTVSIADLGNQLGDGLRALRGEFGVDLTAVLQDCFGSGNLVGQLTSCVVNCLTSLCLCVPGGLKFREGR